MVSVEDEGEQEVEWEGEGGEREGRLKRECINLSRYMYGAIEDISSIVSSFMELSREVNDMREEIWILPKQIIIWDRIMHDVDEWYVEFGEVLGMFFL